MPNRKRAVPPAAGAGDKPVAPDDLWTKLDEAIANAGNLMPPASFTAVQYGERIGLPPDVARKRLDVMLRRGILESGKSFGKRWYRVKEGK